MLNSLADKYWRGACSEAEEQMLFTALEKGELKASQEELAEYLSFLKKEKDTSVLGEDFDQEILRRIHQTPVKPLFSQTWIKVAAAIAFVASLSFGIQLLKTPGVPVQHAKTQSESNIAFLEVQKALYILSSNLNEGMDQARLLHEFDKAEQKLKTSKNERTKKNKRKYESN